MPRTTAKSYTFGPINVTVTNVGRGRPPWDDDPSIGHEEYDVVVDRGGRHQYRTKAWGSRAEYKEHRLDHGGIGALVVEELASANADPDEYVEMVMGDATGRDALKRGQSAEKTVAAALDFGSEALEAAMDDIREKGLD